MGKGAWLEDALKRHRGRSPPMPKREARFVYVVDDRAIEIPIRISEAKLDALRGLFAGKTDSANRQRTGRRAARAVDIRQ
jgi:hypothetical protein